MKRFKMARLWSFTWKFTVVHVATYAVCGILFMIVTDYFGHFAQDPVLGLVMKPADALSVRLSIPIQLFRGALLALALYPFHEVILRRPNGWLKLFLALFVLTGIGAVVTGPGSIEGLIYTNFDFNPLIGLPETVAQTLGFSWLFCAWQNRSMKGRIFESAS
ncbi:MAG TPA: hypothetical protein PKE04_15725 [Clostridia bacterium]|nr:hypothetical protein [Clostridia bacterium]